MHKRLHLEAAVKHPDSGTLSKFRCISNQVCRSDAADRCQGASPQPKYREHSLWKDAACTGQSRRCCSRLSPLPNGRSQIWQSITVVTRVRLMYLKFRIESTRCVWRRGGVLPVYHIILKQRRQPHDVTVIPSHTSTTCYSTNSHLKHHRGQCGSQRKLDFILI